MIGLFGSLEILNNFKRESISKLFYPKISRNPFFSLKNISPNYWPMEFLKENNFLIYQGSGRTISEEFYILIMFTYTTPWPSIKLITLPFMLPFNNILPSTNISIKSKQTINTRKSNFLDNPAIKAIPYQPTYGFSNRNNF